MNIPSPREQAAADHDAAALEAMLLNRKAEAYIAANAGRPTTPALAAVYPQYYFQVPTDVTHMDIYAIARMVKLNDPVLHHSFKKIALSGVRTGGKSAVKDITEARDTLNRWLEMEGSK